WPRRRIASSWPSWSSWFMVSAAGGLLRRVEERRLRALHVAQTRAVGREQVGSHRARRVADGAGEPAPGVLESQVGDHVVLLDAVARGAEAAHETVAAIDRHAAGEDLGAVREHRRTGSGAADRIVAEDAR